MVATKGRFEVNGPSSVARLRHDVDDDTEYAGPLAILVSRKSASAAEVVVGAIKDYERGLIIGDTQTFGKGTAQQLFQLPASKGVLKITTDVFYRPNGMTPQGMGVSPHVVVESVHHRDPTVIGQRDHALTVAGSEPFLSSETQGVGIDRWRPLTTDEIAYVAARSLTRKAGYVKALTRTLDAEDIPNLNGMVQLKTIKSRRSRDLRRKERRAAHQSLKSSRVLESTEILTDLITYRRNTDSDSKAERVQEK